MPPGVLRSRSFTRFTIRVGCAFGQSVLLVVSIISCGPPRFGDLSLIQILLLGLSVFRGLRRPAGNAVVEILGTARHKGGASQ